MEYRVSIKKNDKWQWELVKGTRVQHNLEGLESVKLFAHHNIASRGGKWAVSELTTGAAVGYGDTREQAIVDAKYMLTRHRISECLERMEKTKKYLRKQGLEVVA